MLLLGDGCVDYRNHTGTGKKNRVPVHLSRTSGLSVTPDDNWYVAIEGDDALPEMLVGRISAESPEAASQVVRKIIGYEEAADYQPRKALFVADNNEDSFEAISEGLTGYVPPDFDVRRVYLRSYGSVEQARRDIFSNFDEGMLLTNYVGHGDVNGWAGERILTTSDVALLDNEDRLTFVTSLECLNGYFAHYACYSLGEELVSTTNKGAIGVFAQSGYGYIWEHEILGRELFPLLFGEETGSLGKIATQSKIAAYGSGATEDILKSFVLLADPATPLKIGPRQVAPAH